MVAENLVISATANGLYPNNANHQAVDFCRDSLLYGDRQPDHFRIPRNISATDVIVWSLGLDRNGKYRVLPLGIDTPYLLFGNHPRVETIDVFKRKSSPDDERTRKLYSVSFGSVHAPVGIDTPELEKVCAPLAKSIDAFAALTVARSVRAFDVLRRRKGLHLHEDEAYGRSLEATRYRHIVICAVAGAISPGADIETKELYVDELKGLAKQLTARAPKIAAALGAILYGLAAFKRDEEQAGKNERPAWRQIKQQQAAQLQT